MKNKIMNKSFQNKTTKKTMNIDFLTNCCCLKNEVKKYYSNQYQNDRGKYFVCNKPIDFLKTNTLTIYIGKPSEYKKKKDNKNNITLDFDLFNKLKKNNFIILKDNLYYFCHYQKNPMLSTLELK